LYGQILADIGLLSTNEGEWFNLSPNVPADCVQSS
jgi:hypothetical protein